MCCGYKWEALKLSPHTHAGVPVRRVRVFYIGVRRTAVARARVAGGGSAGGSASAPSTGGVVRWADGGAPAGAQGGPDLC